MNVPELLLLRHGKHQLFDGWTLQIWDMDKCKEKHERMNESKYTVTIAPQWTYLSSSPDSDLQLNKAFSTHCSTYNTICGCAEPYAPQRELTAHQIFFANNRSKEFQVFWDHKFLPIPENAMSPLILKPEMHLYSGVEFKYEGLHIYYRYVISCRARNWLDLISHLKLIELPVSMLHEDKLSPKMMLRISLYLTSVAEFTEDMALCVVNYLVP